MKAEFLPYAHGPRLRYAPMLILLVPEGRQISAAFLSRLGEHLRRGGRDLRVCFQVDLHQTQRCSYRILGSWPGNRTQLYTVLAELFCELSGPPEVEEGDRRA